MGNIQQVEFSLLLVLSFFLLLCLRQHISLLSCIFCCAHSTSFFAQHTFPWPNILPLTTVRIRNALPSPCPREGNWEIKWLHILSYLDAPAVSRGEGRGTGTTHSSEVEVPEYDPFSLEISSPFSYFMVLQDPLGLPKFCFASYCSPAQ